MTQINDAQQNDSHQKTLCSSTTAKIKGAMTIRRMTHGRTTEWQKDDQLDILQNKTLKHYRVILGRKTISSMAISQKTIGRMTQKMTTE